ncbi:MAG: DUF4391 domain-containing protein [Bacteroides sp.]|nr:DUF4391 domain-containing protein [Bacteroides sp.]
MYGLPQTTEVRKQLPKKAIYAKFDLKPSQRESFDADVSTIYIIGVVSPKTLPAIAEGTEVKEIYLLAVQLKRKVYDPKNIALLTRLIPQRMVFALQYEGEVQFAIYHTKLICSEWMVDDVETRPAVSLQGINLDIVWESLVRSIGGILPEKNFSLTEQIFFSDLREKTLKQIATLERKMVGEKQPRRKRELFEQIKKLKKLL